MASSEATHTYGTATRLGNYQVHAYIDYSNGPSVRSAYHQVQVSYNDHVFNETGGSNTSAMNQGKGSAAVDGSGPFVELKEGDSFQASLSRSIIKLESANYQLIAFEHPEFSSASAHGSTPIHDAFEIALLDSDGKSLVQTIGAGSDAFFNLTDGQGPLYAPGVSFVAGRLVLDLSGIATGTEMTLVYRLVNDDGVPGSSVKINTSNSLQMPVWVFDDGVRDGISGQGTPYPGPNGDGKLLLVDLDGDNGEGTISTVTDYGKIKFTIDGITPYELPHQSTSLLESVAITSNGVAYFVTNKISSTRYDVPELDPFFKAAPQLFKLDLNQVWLAEAAGEGWRAEHVGAINFGGTLDAQYTGLSIDPTSGKMYLLAQIGGESVLDAVYELDINNPHPSTGDISAVHVMTLDDTISGHDIKVAEDMRFDSSGNLFVLNSDESSTHDDTIYIVDLANETIERSVFVNFPDVVVDLSDSPVSHVGTHSDPEGLGIDPLTGDFIVSDTRFGDTDRYTVLYRLQKTSETTFTAKLLDDFDSDYFDSTNSSDPALIADAEGMTIVSLPNTLPGNLPVQLSNGVKSSNIDFEELEDITSSFNVNFGTTSLNQRTRNLYANLDLTYNNKVSVLREPLLLVLKNLTGADPKALRPDGYTPGGDPFFEITDLAYESDDQALAFDAVIAGAQIAIQSPAGEPFSFDLRVMGKVNAAPEIVNLPAEKVIAGQTFTFTPETFDREGDDVTVKLLTVPLDPNNSFAPVTDFDVVNNDPDDVDSLEWITTGSDIGAFNFTLLVEDSLGATALYTYNLEVTAVPDNGPPNFISEQIVEAYVNTEYTYAVEAHDDDPGDTLTYTFDVSTGTHPTNADIDLTNLSFNSTTGEVTWTPKAEDVGKILWVTEKAADDYTIPHEIERSYQIKILAEPGNHDPVIIETPGPEFTVSGVGGTAMGDVSVEGEEVPKIYLDLGDGEKITKKIKVTIPGSGGATDKVDILLLLDDTGSFQTALGQLAPLLSTYNQQTKEYEGTIAELIDSPELSGLDLGFGIARFEDYSLSTVNEYDYDYADRPYILNQPIVESGHDLFGAAIHNALSRSAYGSGGNDLPESLIEALYQTATGAGFDGIPSSGSTLDGGEAGYGDIQYGTGTDGDVPAYSTYPTNQSTLSDSNNDYPNSGNYPSGMLVAAGDQGGAGFRDDAIKIILVATDNGTTYRDDEPDVNTETPHMITGRGGAQVSINNILLNGGAETDLDSTNAATIQGTVDALVNTLDAYVVGLGTATSESLLKSLAIATGAVDGGEPIYYSLGSVATGQSLNTGIESTIKEIVGALTRTVDLDFGEGNSHLIDSYPVINGDDEAGPGETVEFEVTFVGDGEAHAFSVEFMGNETESLGSIPIVLNTGYRGEVVAYDPDGHDLTYEFVGEDNGASIDEDSGVVTWDPVLTDPGVAEDFDFTVKVTDGHGGGGPKKLDRNS